MPQTNPHNGGKRDLGVQLLQELEALSLALHRTAPSSTSPYPLAADPPPKHDSLRKVYHLTSRRDAGKSLFPRRSAASSAQSSSLDLAEKTNLQSTSSLLLPPSLPRDRSINDCGGLPLWHSQSFDNQVPAVGNFKDGVQDSIDFSQKLEVSQQRQQEKKGFWKWKPFRFAANMGQQRLHVIFSLHVHRIEGLPASMNGLRLTVHWNRKEEGLQTMPSRVFQGVAEFDETLRQRCSVYSSKSDSQGIKYESKLFTLSVVALDVDELEFGKHHLDLSRLLPEFPGGSDEDEKPVSWTTNFELTGIAKGSTLVVTFNYDLVHHESTDDSDAQIERSGSRRSGVLFNSVPSSAHTSPLSMPSNASVSPSRSEPCADPDSRLAMEHLSLDDVVGKNSSNHFARDDIPSPVTGLSGLEGGLFEFKPSLKYSTQGADQVDFTFPSTQSEQVETGYSNRSEENIRDDDETDFVVEDRGMETSLSSGGVETHGTEDQHLGTRGETSEFSNIESGEVREDWGDSQEAEKAMDIRQNTVEESAAEERPFQESRPRTESIFPTDSDADLDDEVDLVAGEFLNLLETGCTIGDLNSDSEMDSPRARLLKQFEREALLDGGIGLAFDEGALAEGNTHGTAKEQLGTEGPGVTSCMEERVQSWGPDDTLELASIMEAAESELQKATQTMRSKSRAKMLEDAETEALFQQWGLNEKSFESSPPRSGTSWGGPFYSAKLKLSAPPPLASGLGSVIQLRDGGSLRSMSPSHFPKNGKNVSLVMQVSRPIVVPAATGSTATDILRHFASFGTENLVTHAMAAMPLDDITGKTPEEVAAGGIANMHGSDQGEGPSFQRRHRLQTSTMSECQNTKMQSRDTPTLKKYGGYDEPGKLEGYVSLEDLAPLAMQNIEALAISGLKVQGDMAEEEAPSYLDAAAWGIVDGHRKQDRGGIGTSQGVAGMHFGTSEHEGHKAVTKCDDPLSMAITLEEWTRLDAGGFDCTDSMNKTLAVLAAHKVNHREWELAQWEETKGQKHSKRAGIMGNTLTIAMLVQLRDPFNNYEPVGAPMMALVQAERVMVPPKPQIGKRVSIRGNSEEDEELKEVTVQKEESPQFKIQGVHISGLKPADEEVKKGKGEQEQRKGWGIFGWVKQRQSGSQWLAAQGMGKTTKTALLKSKPAPTKTKVKPGETLWSISARVHGSGEKWRDIAALNPQIRNPDVIFPNDNIRTR